MSNITQSSFRRTDKKPQRKITEDNTRKHNLRSLVFGPISHPYQRSVIQTLIILLDFGELDLIFECLKVLLKAAHMHRSYDQAQYWAEQAKIVAIAMASPGMVIDVWIHHAELLKDQAKYEEAMNCLLKALGYAFRYGHPSQFDIYEHIAKCFYYLGQLDEAKLFHEKASMGKGEADELLRATALKVENEPLGDRQLYMKPQLLNSMWLPISTAFHSYFQSPQRKQQSVENRIRSLRNNIREYYECKNGIVLAQGVVSEPTPSESLLSMFEMGGRPRNPIFLSHKTQNKNIELFMTQESIIPRVVKMMAKLENLFYGKLISKSFKM